MYNFPLFHLIFSTFSSSSHLDNFLDVITEHDLQHDKLTHVTSDATEIQLTLTSYDRKCNNIDESDSKKLNMFRNHIGLFLMANLRYFSYLT